ncbi:MAG: hypothetical protein EOO78_19665, partial [Oxalobacteraceae bacterium]
MHIDPVSGREIGVFDSGVGGFTVLQELRQLLPTASLRYLADTACAPYGSRSGAEIRARSLAISQHLIAKGAGLIVVACNTATAHAIEAGDLDSPLLRRLVEQHCAPLRSAGVDTALLGCTHYPLIEPLWQAALGP